MSDLTSSSDAISRDLIFISWSKEESKNIANALKDVIEYAFDSVEVFVSDRDIEYGSRSMEVIAKALARSVLALIIITPDNFDSKWLHYEAGAIARDHQKNHVIPLVVGMEIDSVNGPLAQFQGAPLAEESLKEVILQIAQMQGIEGEKALGRTERARENLWDKVSMAAQNRKNQGSVVADFDNSEALKELLSLTRGLAARSNNPTNLPLIRATPAQIAAADASIAQLGLTRDSVSLSLDASSVVQIRSTPGAQFQLSAETLSRLKDLLASTGLFNEIFVL